MFLIVFEQFVITPPLTIKKNDTTQFEKKKINQHCYQIKHFIETRDCIVLKYYILFLFSCNF